MLADFFSILLEIQQLVGNLFGGKPIEYGHDAAGEVEVGSATIRDENAGVGRPGDWLRRLRRCLSRCSSDGYRRQKEGRQSPIVR